ncbi:IS4 family transposase [Limosilactobacillus reuteri]|uniref:IS4 family transposase n=1 Tax=Limosilactobacillus reuteri TaxID=1598 RepID=A0AAP2R140_LIMRT|nr:IS4 family transposase [Limosilactobacillus reuteri]MCC4477586.1 IS4 family transposase [Limosilactobacillus reuteri]MCC4477895.1 IS4 family transposase [Limosilactobacillus reuteri]MCC4477896.1 IS4 family transposase [Limosilactobacillus reuteri]MCC4477965.1 IS4 family transposase [Limosilactobacillus reuteri]MCC4478083.1 IS4 family transposase [Limosilactobacillus reuteri]
MVNHTNILTTLDLIINQTCDHIHDFTNSPQDFTRKRKLPAMTLIKTILSMRGNSLNAELFDAFPDLNDQVTVSAFEQQKSKLTSTCFEHIFHQFNQAIASQRRLDHQYHVFAIDGSDFNLPWNPQSAYVCNFPHQKAQCQMHVNALYDLLNKSYQDCVIQPKAKIDERKSVLTMMERLPQNSIVIMDRGYPSFNLIEHFNRRPQTYYVLRASLSGGIKEVQALPNHECDQQIKCRVTTSNHYYITHKDQEVIHCINHHRRHYKAQRSKNTRDQRWDFETFCTIKFRTCKFQIGTTKTGQPEWEVLLTNLPVERFPLSQMKKLYHLRWGVETAFCKLKYDLGAIQFHSKKDQFIETELYANLTMYNVVSAIINQVPGLPTHRIHWYTVNFKMATKIVRYYFQKNWQARFDQLLGQLQAYILPIRPGRKDKRKLKTKQAVSFAYRVA